MGAEQAQALAMVMRNQKDDRQDGLHFEPSVLGASVVRTRSPSLSDGDSRQLSLQAYEAAAAVFQGRAAAERAARQEAEEQADAASEVRQEAEQLLASAVRGANTAVAAQHEMAELVDREGAARSAAERRADQALHALGALQATGSAGPTPPVPGLRAGVALREAEASFSHTARTASPGVRRSRRSAIGSARQASSPRRVGRPAATPLRSPAATVGQSVAGTRRLGRYNVGMKVLARASDTGVWQEAVVVSLARTGALLSYSHGRQSHLNTTLYIL
jgi:hypothetical protein